MDERERERRQWLTLHGRIEWVLTNKKKTVENESRWSEKAGKTRQQISTLKTRSRNALARGETFAAHFSTIASLARVAEVSIPWFGEGKGRPDDLPDATGRYSWILTLRDAAKAAGVESWYVRDFETMLATDENEYVYDQAYRMLVDQWNKRGGAGRESPLDAADLANEVGGAQRPSGTPSEVPPPKKRRKGRKG